MDNSVSNSLRYFTAAMRWRRKNLGLTQQMVADRAGLSITTVNQIEGLKRTDPEFDTLVKIATVLDDSVDNLVWSGKLMSTSSAETYRRFVGLALASIRESKGLTRNAVALRAEISPSYLNEVELGRSSPTIDKIYTICRVLNIEPESVLIEAKNLQNNG